MRGGVRGRGDGYSLGGRSAGAGAKWLRLRCVARLLEMSQLTTRRGLLRLQSPMRLLRLGLRQLQRLRLCWQHLVSGPL